MFFKSWYELRFTVLASLRTRDFQIISIFVSRTKFGGYKVLIERLQNVN